MLSVDRWSFTLNLVVDLLERRTSDVVSRRAYLTLLGFDNVLRLKRILRNFILQRYSVAST